MTYIPGGGGGGSIATSADVALNNPLDGEVLTFNSGTSLWQNEAVAAGTVADGSITNAKIATNAAIAQSKLSLAVANTDVASNAAISQSKLSLAITNAEVASGAAIAESKLSLASDAAAATASRRTLGTGATQAAAGNHTHAISAITSLQTSLDAKLDDSLLGANSGVASLDSSGKLTSTQLPSTTKPTIPMVWTTGPSASVATGQTQALRIPNASTIIRCSLRTFGAPVGSALSVDFTQSTGAVTTLSISAGSTTEQVTTTLTNTALSAGGYIWVTVTSIGSSTAAVGVTAQFDIRET
jgi:hypothetical protein